MKLLIDVFVIFVGYENASGDWEEYPHYVNLDGLDVGSAVSIFMLLPPKFF
jgi:hypothetical protein